MKTFCIFALLLIGGLTLCHSEQSVQDQLNDLKNAGQDIASNAADSVKNVVNGNKNTGLWNKLKSNILGDTADKVKDSANAAQEGAQKLQKKTVDQAGSLWSKVVGSTNSAMKVAMDNAGVVEDTADNIEETLQDAYDQIGDKMKTATEMASEAAGSLGDNFQNTAHKFIGWAAWNSHHIMKDIHHGADEFERLGTALLNHLNDKSDDVKDYTIDQYNQFVKKLENKRAVLKKKSKALDNKTDGFYRATKTLYDKLTPDDKTSKVEEVWNTVIKEDGSLTERLMSYDFKVEELLTDIKEGLKNKVAAMKNRVEL